MGDLQRRFGRLVAAHRKRMDLTQEQLAERASISIDTVRKIETAASGASFPMIEKIALALEVDEAELFSTLLPSGSFNRGKFQEISLRLAGLSEKELRWVGDLLEVALKLPR
ncbi:Transcriptional regulator, XRE family [Mesorhizobium metallidurans STM 2683]|uniref:Transcriptional regulator, XRE family n=1 Tax=Mesorhizobium metallidurans STM 2683 TaxID=1297569 RepID=M5EG48_9HYPH|nr:helix-turn-helix transcriptional regulator [Mesorhizobium metallidurans]CCV03317.1 Transcriptional regulator, XRE family [Mesorhizobium metallidurans STM 2683]